MSGFLLYWEKKILSTQWGLPCPAWPSSRAAGPNLTKWVLFYCTEKKNPRYSTRAAMSCMTLSYLLFQYCLISISWSLQFNSALLSHMLFLLCGVLFTWITLAHHRGLSLCTPYSERHSLTKFLLCFSFPVVLFLFQIRSDQISRSVVSDSLRPHESHHARPPGGGHHQLPEFTQTHVHRVSDAIQPSHPLSSPSPLAPNPSQHQSLFQWVNFSFLAPSFTMWKYTFYCMVG